MRARIIGVSFALLCMVFGTVRAQQEHDAVPEKAVCRTCEIRGASHGAEDVAAWREYEDTRYFFCSQDCAKAFDAFPAAYVPHPLPRPAPNATLSTLAGEEFRLDEHKGRVVLLDFWATWCTPCVKAMPLLDKLHTKWADANFMVLGVSIDENAGEVVPKFVDKKKIRYPIALDTAQIPAWQAFHVAAIPAMFLIDEQGRIVAEWRGEIDTDDVRKAVERLLAETSAKD